MFPPQTVRRTNISLASNATRSAGAPTLILPVPKPSWSAVFVLEANAISWSDASVHFAKFATHAAYEDTPPASVCVPRR